MRFDAHWLRRTRGGAILHVPAPPRRSRPWSQGTLAGGASADCRSASYGLLRTGRGRGSWATAPRPGYRQYTCKGPSGRSHIPLAQY